MTQDHLAMISAALAELKAAEQTVVRARSRLELAFEAAVQQGLQPLPLPTAIVTEHRREHRPGRPRVIPNDPALQAFIEARIDRMTFDEIAADMAAHFPHERCVGKSAIHSWWQDTQKGKRQI